MSRERGGMNTLNIENKIFILNLCIKMSFQVIKYNYGNEIFKKQISFFEFVLLQEPTEV